jgi:hypothetical protein
MSNQLSSLPETTHSLEKLEKLFLHGNPGLGLPDEVLGPTREEVDSQKRSPKSPTKAAHLAASRLSARDASGIKKQEAECLPRHPNLQVHAALQIMR